MPGVRPASGRGGGAHLSPPGKPMNSVVHNPSAGMSVPGVRESSFDGFDDVDDKPPPPPPISHKDALAVKAGGFSNAMSKLGGQVNVNGADFWIQWAAAGGDADRYVKESMPNYAITAGLLITMTFPYALEAPDHVLEYSPEMGHTFTAVMMLATMLNVFIIVLTLTIYQQYCCTIDDDTALNFAAHFGYLVPLQGTILLLLIVLFCTGMALSIVTQDYGADTQEDNIFYIVLVLLGVGCILLIVWFCIDIPRWNQTSNYLPVMTDRVTASKQVQALRLPTLSALVATSVGSAHKAEDIVRILTEHGCGDSIDLLHYMQSFVHDENDKRVGSFAKTLEPLGIRLFDALRIAEHIGIVTLTHHKLEVARHVPSLVPTV